MESIIDLIESQIKQRLTANEIHYVAVSVKNTKPIMGETKQQLLFRFIDKMCKDIIQQRQVRNQLNVPMISSNGRQIHANNSTFDIREYQTSTLNQTDLTETNAIPPDTEQVIKRSEPEKNIEIDKLFGTRTPFELQMIFNPQAAYLQNYIIFDSKYRRRESASGGPFNKISFGYAPGTNITNGIINSVGKIRDIVSIRIYRPVIPYVSQLFVTDARRISIAIEEFQAQAIILSNGRRTHFLLNYDLDMITGDLLNIIIEDFNDGIFKFSKPIQTFETLTLTIGNPNQIVTFPQDTYNVTFTYANPTILTFSTAHGVPSATSVYITMTTFTTDNPAADAAIIAQFNSTLPILATYVSATELSVDINSTTVTPKAGLICEVFIETRRIIVPMEITYLRSN